MRWLKIWGTSGTSQVSSCHPSEVELIAYGASIVPFQDVEVGRIVDAFEDFTFKLNEPVELTNEQEEYRNVFLTMVIDEKLAKEVSVAVAFIHFVRKAFEFKGVVWREVLNVLLAISLQSDTLIEHLSFCNITKFKVLTAAYYAYYQMPQNFLQALDRITNEASRKRLLTLLDANTFLAVLPWWYEHKVSNFALISNAINSPVLHVDLSNEDYHLMLNLMLKYSNLSADDIVMKLRMGTVFQNLMHLGNNSFVLEAADRIDLAIKLYELKKDGLWTFIKYRNLIKKFFPLWKLPLDEQIEYFNQIYKRGLCKYYYFGVKKDFTRFNEDFIVLHYQEHGSRFCLLDDLVFIDKLLQHGHFYFVNLLENLSTRHKCPLYLCEYEDIIYRYSSGSLMRRPGFPHLDKFSRDMAVSLLKRLIGWYHVKSGKGFGFKAEHTKYTVRALCLFLRFFSKKQLSSDYERLMLLSVRKYFRRQIFDGEFFDLVFERQHFMFIQVAESLVKNDPDPRVVGGFLFSLFRYRLNGSLRLLKAAAEFGLKVGLIEKLDDISLSCELDDHDDFEYVKNLWKSVFVIYSAE